MPEIYRKTLKSVTLAAGTVEAVFSTFGTMAAPVVDLDGDMVLPGAIPSCAVALSSWNHGSWNAGLPPIGVGRIMVTRTEAILSGRFFMETEAGAATFQAVAELAAAGLGQWSYSLSDVVGTTVRIDGLPVRVISKVGTIREVSPVMAAASIGTRTLSAKDRDVLEAAKRHLRDVTEKDRHELQRIYANFRAREELDAAGAEARAQRVARARHAMGRPR